MNVDGFPQEETPRARQAWLDYWDLGPARSLGKLLEHYFAVSGAGGKVPTTRLRSLEQWSSAHGWRDRVMAKQAAIADQAEAALVAEREQFARQRLEQSRHLHTVPGAWVEAVIARIRAGEMDRLPLAGHSKKINYSSETQELETAACGLCQDAPRPDCPACQGTGQAATGKGKRRKASGTKVVHVPGLMDFAASMVRAMETGHKLERQESGIGEGAAERMVDEILQLLPPDVSGPLARGLAENLAGGPGGPDSRQAPLWHRKDNGK